MALGPFCKALGIDEEVLGGQKVITCDIKSLTNGVIWELKRYKTAKKLTMKEIVDWIIKIFHLNCESSETMQEQLNEKLENLSTLRNTLTKSPNRYRGEMERLNNWQFDLPTNMGVEPAPAFEPTVQANLGPKLLKVLKEKGGDDDVIDMSGDDDDQVKKRKAREEIVHLKRDLGSAKKIIATLNDKMSDLNKRCQILNDLSKSSVSERRRIETDILKLQVDWNKIMLNWHDCMERLNHVNSNKGNYLDVGYMVRRNKTKQGIFDELNFEFEKTLEEYKYKVISLIEKERRKKKIVSREYRQKSKTDRKRVRQNDEDNEENKKPCLSEEGLKQTHSIMPVDEFIKSEKIDEFKCGKYVNALKVIYTELTSSSVPCNNVHEIIFAILGSLEPLKTDKIPSQAFAGNIFMEARMAVSLQSFFVLLKSSKISICNDGETKFALINNTDYEVTLSDDTKVKIGVRDLSDGSPDTSLNVFKDLVTELVNAKSEGNQNVEAVAKIIKSLVTDKGLLEKKLIEILFSFKQKIFPLIASSYKSLPEFYKPKCNILNNFCTGIYFLLGLAKLADVTTLAWESFSNGNNSIDELKNIDTSQTLSKIISKISALCEKIDLNDSSDMGTQFKDFVAKEKKLLVSPLAPCNKIIFNIIFHNSAGIWFYHKTGILYDFFLKLKKEVKSESINRIENEEEIILEEGENCNSEDNQSSGAKVEKMEIGESTDCKNIDLKFFIELFNDKYLFPFSRALGLIGKLMAVPLWTVLEGDEIQINDRYNTLLTKIEYWSKDSTKFMKGQERVFEDVPVSHDAVYISLVNDDDKSDALTKELLELFFTAFVPYVKYILHHNKLMCEKINGESSIDEVDSVMPIHEDFGYFDRITMNIHSITNFAVDALTSLSKKNGAWEDKLCIKDNFKVFDVVEQDSSKQMKVLYKRKIAISKIKQVQSPKMDLFTKSQIIEKKYKLIDDLIKWGGLWKSEKEIEAQIKDMKESDRLNAFRAQISFRRHILGEDGENGLLDLASEGECFNAEKLHENLRAILKKECKMTESNVLELASATNDKEQMSSIYELCQNAPELKPVSEFSRNVPKGNFHWLLGKLVSHSLVSEQGKNDDIGVCIARKKGNGMFSYFIRYRNKGVINVSVGRIAEDLKSQNLKLIHPSVSDLVGSHLSRAFIKDDGDLEWHDCKVISVTSNGSDFVVEFDIYDDFVQLEDISTHVPDPENFTFIAHLLEDYKNGHLRLL